jgi:hypothetical protein
MAKMEKKAKMPELSSVRQAVTKVPAGEAAVPELRE